jgi:hypothetical protein
MPHLGIGGGQTASGKQKTFPRTGEEEVPDTLLEKQPQNSPGDLWEPGHIMEEGITNKCAGPGLLPMKERPKY